jgi:CubicO group peptidase (beta-lactamase class C family)
MRKILVWLALVWGLAGCAAATPVATATLPAATSTQAQPAPTLTQVASAVPSPAVRTPAPLQTPTLARSLTPTLDAALRGRLEALDAFFAKQAKEGNFGGAVLLAQGGRILLSQGYGLADAGHKLAITPRTRFRIASLTKQFTAAAVLLLQARGRLDVADRVCSYLKDCPPEWQAITLEQILTHTSGIPDFFGFDDFDAKADTLMTPAQLVAWIQAKPLNFTPGKLYNYSNSGYAVLGDVIERVSGQTYGAFLKQNIFDPLHMADSGYDRSTAGLAVGYKGAGDKAGVVDPSVLFAAGGVYSSVEDLYRWDQALYTQQILPQALLDEMFRARVAVPNQPGTSYGYGWVIASLGSRRLVRHNGVIAGYLATIQRFPDDDATVIILCNRDDFLFSPAVDRAIQTLFP